MSLALSVLASAGSIGGLGDHSPPVVGIIFFAVVLLGMLITLIVRRRK